MEWSVFERTLEHVAHYCAEGTQGEVALTGIGEGILYPRFRDAVKMTRAVIGNDRLLTCSTNGVAVDDEVVAIFAEFGVRAYVSLHRPELATTAAYRFANAGVPVVTNHAFVDSALDWAGQVEWHVSAAKGACQYLRRGWAVVRQDGQVVACCMDAHDKHPIGHVNDAIGSLQTFVTPLCASCNLSPPLEMIAEAC